MNFGDVKDELLKVLYTLLRESDLQEYYRPVELWSAMGEKTSVAFVSRACQSLTSDALFSHSFYEEEDHYGLTDEGIDLAEEILGFAKSELQKEAEIPASDRLVGLDHNSSDYLAIKSELDDLYEKIRSDNEVGESAEERSRLLQSLSAAKNLWAAAELQTIQIKVGIILAVENAGRALQKAGKAVGWAILIDSIKSYVKNKIGFDI